MQFAQYVRTFRRHLRLLVLLLLAGIALPLAIDLVRPMEYTSEATVYVSTATAASVGQLASSTEYTQKIVNSYAVIAVSPYVLDAVAEELRLDESAGALAQDVSATVSTDTSVIVIAATRTDARSSLALANEVARQLPVAVRALNPAPQDDSADVKVTVIGQATSASSSGLASLLPRLAIGAAVGFAFWVVLAVLHDLLQTRIRDAADALDSSAAVPVLGSVAAPGPQSSRTEDMRRLMNRLAPDGPGPAVIGVLPVDGHRLDPLAQSIAQAMADTGLRATVVRVALSAADRPSSVPPPRRATHSPAADLPVTGGRDLVAPDGGLPAIVADAMESYDRVLLELEPGAAMSDVETVAMLADFSVLVCTAKKSTKARLESVVTALIALQVDVRGVVIAEGVGRARGPAARTPSAAPTMGRISA